MRDKNNFGDMPGGGLFYLGNMPCVFVFGHMETGCTGDIMTGLK